MNGTAYQLRSLMFGPKFADPSKTLTPLAASTLVGVIDAELISRFAISSAGLRDHLNQYLGKATFNTLKDLKDGLFTQMAKYLKKPTPPEPMFPSPGGYITLPNGWHEGTTILHVSDGAKSDPLTLKHEIDTDKYEFSVALYHYVSPVK